MLLQCGGADWWAEAQDALRRFQQEAWDRDQAGQAADKELCRQQLSSELAAVAAAAALGARTLMEHLYATHPPKNAAHRLPAAPDWDNGLKRLLRDAVVHYSPDKALQFGQPLLWQTLCEEACKLLNDKYDRFK